MNRPIKAHIWDREANEHYVEPAWCSERLFARLVRVNAGIVEQCADGEWASARAEQRVRNMRAAGLH